MNCFSTPFGDDILFQFLVDTTGKRLIKMIGETPVEDYPDGDSEMEFQVRRCFTDFISFLLLL